MTSLTKAFSKPMHYFLRRTLLYKLYCIQMTEICNPLGSRAAVNQLLMVYYTLRPALSETLGQCCPNRLLAIAKSTDMDECGVDVILKRIDKDLKLLYNDIKINSANGQFDLAGAVIAICVDTPAQHELAGFKEGVGFAYSKCRH